MTIFLVAIAVWALVIADVLAASEVRERWLCKQQRVAAQTFQPVTDWVWSRQREISRLPLGSLYCYYFKQDAST